MNNPMNQKPGNLKLNFSYCTQQSSGPGEVTLFLWSTVFHVATVSYLSSPLGCLLSISNSTCPNLNHWFLSSLSQSSLSTCPSEEMKTPFFPLLRSKSLESSEIQFSERISPSQWGLPWSPYIKQSFRLSSTYVSSLIHSLLHIYWSVLSLFQYTVISKDYRIWFNFVPIFISNRVKFSVNLSWIKE